MTDLERKWEAIKNDPKAWQPASKLVLQNGKIREVAEGAMCWYCDSTEELSPRERSYDSAPLHGWECKECRDTSREHNHELGQFEIGALLRDHRLLRQEQS